MPNYALLEKEVSGPKTLSGIEWGLEIESSISSPHHTATEEQQNASV